jgi:hypothetical protein
MLVFPEYSRYPIYWANDTSKALSNVARLANDVDG